MIAGGALAGVVVALLSVDEGIFKALQFVNAEHAISDSLGQGGYNLLGFCVLQQWLIGYIKLE